MSNRYTRRINLYINGKEVRNDIGSIQKAMYKLRNEQRYMTLGSKEYEAQTKKIKYLKSIIDRHNASLRKTGERWFSLKNIAAGFNKYFAMFGTFIAGFTGIALGLKKTISQFAEFDDKLADVMKTTGMTKNEVKELNEKLKLLDTRSAQQELLDLARVGGKLGITGKENLLGFVKAADQIKIALSEDLGDNIENSIRELGKLSDVFKINEQYGIEDALLKIGSAINSLGAASTANEPFMVEFTKRVAGIAPSADISIDKVLGLAATLDQLGQTSEVSSTVYSQVVPNMFKDTATYASIAGMSVNDFNKILESDANEAFIKLLEGLNSNKGGLREMALKLQELGLKGKRSISVLGVLANNTKLLREQQAFANQEFIKGTSLTEEFNTKNNTAQATLEKYRKALFNISVELGETLLPVLTMSTRGMSYLIKALNIIIPWLIKYRKVIAVLTTIIAAHYSRLALLWVLEKARNITMVQSAAATRIMIALTGKATMAQKRLLVTTRLLNTATKSTPWGLIISLLAGAAAAYFTFRNKVADAVKEQNEFNEVLKTGNELLAQNKTLEERASIAKNLSKEQLQNLKTDLQYQIKTEEDFHATLLQKLKKRLSEDEKLSQLNENLKTENLSEEQKERIQIAIGNRKVQVARELEEENKGNQQRLKNLKSHLEEVNSELESKGGDKDTDFLGTNNFEDAKKALQSANITEINLLKEKLLQKKITEQQFRDEQYTLELAHLTAMRELYRSHGEDFINIEGQIIDKKIAWQQQFDKMMKLSEDVSQKITNDERQMFIDIDREMQEHIDNVAEQGEKETEKYIDNQAKREKAEKRAYEIRMDNASRSGEMMAENAETVEEAGRAILNSIRQQIKAYIAEAVAVQATKALKNVPFPFNIAAAAAAGATTTFLFNKLIPEFSDGGFTGTGGKFEPAGIVHKGEYVINQELMQLPAVEQIVASIEAMRLNPSSISQMALPAMSEGGMTSTNPTAEVTTPGTDSRITQALNANTRAMEEMLKMKIYASIEDIKTADQRFTEIQDTRGL